MKDILDDLKRIIILICVWVFFCFIIGVSFMDIIVGVIIIIATSIFQNLWDKEEN